MRNIIALALFCSTISCTSYQKLMMIPANRNHILRDSCDISVIHQLSDTLGAIGYHLAFEQSGLLEEMIKESACDYYASKVYPPREDSTIWLLTIRPVLTGKDEIMLGSLYTLFPRQDSTLVFKRRVKEYSQAEEFESGKYRVFTYTIENDTTLIVKSGAYIF